MIFTFLEHTNFLFSNLLSLKKSELELSWGGFLFLTTETAFRLTHLDNLMFQATLPSVKSLIAMGEAGMSTEQAAALKMSKHLVQTL